MIIDQYISYVRDIRRYSPRTVQIYDEVIRKYAKVVFGTDDVSDNQLIEALNPSELRSYEVTLMDEEKLTQKTVCLHMSALSGFCRFLVKEGYMKSNPVRLVPKPKVEKRLPQFFRHESLQQYFTSTEIHASEDFLRAFKQNPHSYQRSCRLL